MRLALFLPDSKLFLNPAEFAAAAPQYFWPLEPFLLYGGPVEILRAHLVPDLCFYLDFVSAARAVRDPVFLHEFENFVRRYQPQVFYPSSWQFARRELLEAISDMPSERFQPLPSLHTLPTEWNQTVFEALYSQKIKWPLDWQEEYTTAYGNREWERVQSWRYASLFLRHKAKIQAELFNEVERLDFAWTRFQVLYDPSPLQFSTLGQRLNPTLQILHQTQPQPRLLAVYRRQGQVHEKSLTAAEAEAIDEMRDHGLVNKEILAPFLEE